MYFHYARQIYGVSGLGRRAILPPCLLRAIRHRYPNPGDTGYTEHVFSTLSQSDDDVSDLNARRAAEVAADAAALASMQEEDAAIADMDATALEAARHLLETEEQEMADADAQEEADAVRDAERDFEEDYD